MRKRFYRILKIGLLVFIAAILLLVMIFLVFDIHDRKLYLHLFPRPALSAEVLEDYWTNPLPPPKAIRDIVTETKNGDSICLSISSRALWMPGDEEDDIYPSVQKSFALYIDGIYHKPPVAIFLAGFNDNFGPDMSACLQLKDLSTGLHSAEVQFSDTHGRLYTHIWAFRVTS